MLTGDEVAGRAADIELVALIGIEVSYDATPS
jgi:hypothetical protein